MNQEAVFFPPPLLSVAENENNRAVCKFCVMLAVIKKYQLGYFMQLLKSNSKELWTVHPSLYKADGLLAVRVCIRKRPIIFINVINSFSLRFKCYFVIKWKAQYFYINMVSYEDLERVCDIRNRSLQIRYHLLIVSHDFVPSWTEIRTSAKCEQCTAV